MDEPSESPTQTHTGGCSCTTMLVYAMMVVLAVLGFQIGHRWGIFAAVGGSLLGIVLAVPATGILLLIFYGIASIFIGNRE